MKSHIVSATRLQHGRKSPTLIPANHFVDFRPGIDKVIIEDGRAFIRDSQGLLADQEVQCDLLASAQHENLAGTAVALIGMKMQAVLTCPHLSKLGREQRAAALREAWIRNYGDATFVVSVA